MKETTVFQGQEVHVLRNGAGTARVAPRRGARLLDWRVDGREIVRWPADADWANATKIRGGNPVLFPFLARHYADGVLGRWKDAAGVVRELPMHGFARDAAFVPVEGADDEIRMALEESAETLAAYPFRFRFEVAYRLPAPDTLEVEFATTNRSDAPMPYNPGHHFYFALDHRRRADYAIDLPFARTVTMDETGNPIEGLAPVTTTLDRPELVDRLHVGPTATRFAVTDRADGSALEFDLAPRATAPWYCVTTWTQQADSDFYCIEPWLGLPNAISHGQGLRWIAPGATEKAVCAIRFRA